MNKLFKKVIGATLGAVMALGVGLAVGASNNDAVPVHAAETSIYYTFTDKNWTSNMMTTDYATSGGTSKAWTKTKSGSQLTSGQGVQITTTVDSATVTCPDSYDNITGVTIRYCTNASKGVGSLVAKVGDTAGSPASFSITKPSSGGTTLKDASFTFSEASGAVQFIVTCTTNSVYVYGVKITYAEEVDPDAPALTITNDNTYAPKGVGVALSATVDNGPEGSYVSWTANNNKVSFNTTTGTAVTLTAANDAVVSSTAVTVTATLKSSTDETLDTKNTKLYISSALGNSTSNAMPASEAAIFANVTELRDNTLYVKGYVTMIPGNNSKYFWIDDSEGSTQTFEVYKNETGFNSDVSLGAFVVAHGTLDMYNSTPETTDSVIDSCDYFTLSDSEIEVDNTQYVDVTASNVSSGTIAWSKTAGTGDVTLSNTSNSGVRITGNGVGTATVTATLGNLVRNISITVNAYANDWEFADLTLETKVGFKTTYGVGESLDTANLIVTLVEHSETLNDDRETDVTASATFNFDSSAVTSFNLTATYSGHTTDDVVAITVVKAPTTINFGSADGSTPINSTSKTGDDSNGNTWTITSVFSGTTSFSQNASYSQIGASGKTCSSVTFTVTLDDVNYIEAFSAKFGAFGSDAGDITLKVGDKTVGSGSLNGTSDVVVSASVFTIGKTLTIEVTNMTRLKAYYISYTSDNANKTVNDCFADQFMHMSDYDPELETKGTDNGVGTCSTYYPIAKAMFNNMSTTQRGYFVSNSGLGQDYHDAYERLIAWATANGDSLNASNQLVQASRITPFGNNENNSTVIIVIISLISISAIGGYFFLRRKKAN